MSKPIVSIIIPIYNTDQYLDKCIESICRQTYRKIEILLIDDGSTDKSLSICRNFADSDHRIKVYTKKNGGQSSARNMGLDKMTGDYFMFVDSDDWIDEEMIEILMKYILKENADMACCGVQITNNIDTNYSMFKNRKRIRVMNNIDSIRSFLKNDGTSSNVCARIYQKELFADLRFDEGKVFEDVAISYKYFIKSKRTVFIDKPYYFYYQRPGSTMDRRDLKIRLDEIEAADQRYHAIKNNYSKDIAEIAFAEYVFDLIHVKQCLIRDGFSKEEIKQYEDYLINEQKLNNYSYLSYLGMRKKIEAVLMFNLNFIFEFLTKIFVKVKKSS